MELLITWSCKLQGRWIAAARRPWCHWFSRHRRCFFYCWQSLDLRPLRRFIHLLQPHHQAAAGLLHPELQQLRFWNVWNPQMEKIDVNFWVGLFNILIFCNFWVGVILPQNYWISGFPLGFTTQNFRKELLATRSKSIGSIPEDAEGGQGAKDFWINKHST